MNPRAYPAVVFAAGLALRLALIALHPMLYGGDTIIRLMHPERILNSHQMPLLQVIIFAVTRITTSVPAVDCVMALIGALAGLAFYYFATCFTDRTTALGAALLFTCNPFIVGISVVPYQESLMVAGMLFAYSFFATRRYGWSSIALAVGCFARYEAWVAVPVLGLAYVVEHGWTPRRIAAAIALFGWAPLVWILAHAGLSTSGSFVVERSMSLARFWRIYNLGIVVATYTPLIVIGVGLFGVAVAWSRRRERELWWPVMMFALFFVAILFSAHGDIADPQRVVTSREAHIPIVAVYWFAALGLQRLSSRAQQASATAEVPRGVYPEERKRRGARDDKLFWLVVTAGLGLSVYGANRFLATETSRPINQLTYDLAKYLDRRLGARDTILVMAKPLGEPVGFFEQAERVGGAEGLAAARRLYAATAETSPIAYQRTLVQTRVPRQQVLHQSTRCVPLIAVWSDFVPTNESERALVARALAREHQDTVFRADGLSVAVARVDCLR